MLFVDFPVVVMIHEYYTIPPLFQTIADNPDDFFRENSHLIGDAAYPLLKWLLTPFKNYGNLIPMQRHCNKKQSSTRMKIEHWFGTLKGLFRRLQLKLYKEKIEEAPIIVMAACILHNLSIIHHEDVMDWLQDDNDLNDDDIDIDISPPPE